MSIKYNFVQKANPNDRDANKKWYAVPSSESAMSGKAMTRAATANTSTSAIEMEAAMEYLANYIPQQLLQGHTVKVPGLGTFRIAFKSKGVTNLADFNVAAMIREPRILFTPDKALRTSVIQNLTFENGGVLKDGVRYASVIDYLKATGNYQGGASKDDPSDSNGTDPGDDNGGSGTGGNPL